MVVDNITIGSYRWKTVVLIEEKIKLGKKKNKDHFMRITLNMESLTFNWMSSSQSLIKINTKPYLNDCMIVPLFT